VIIVDIIVKDPICVTSLCIRSPGHLLYAARRPLVAVACWFCSAAGSQELELGISSPLLATTSNQLIGWTAHPTNTDQNIIGLMYIIYCSLDITCVNIFLSF